MPVNSHLSSSPAYVFVDMSNGVDKFVFCNISKSVTTILIDAKILLVPSELNAKPRTICCAPLLSTNNCMFDPHHSLSPHELEMGNNRKKIIKILFNKSIKFC